MISIVLRLYRNLADAFPHEFKNLYGEELVQVTEDAVEEIWRRHGVLGLARLLLDIAIRIPAEYWEEIRQDVRYGLRKLAGSPGFTAVALISLSLGICIGTSAFSELNGLVLRALPGVPDPEELVRLRALVSYPDYEHYAELADVFSSTFAYVAPVPFGVSAGGETQRMWGHLVTPSYFSSLGVPPLMGRFPGDEGGEPTVVVSHRFWQNHLGADRSAIGRTIRINGTPCTVIGVGPEDFLGASPAILPADLWIPVTVDESLAPELADNALEQRERAMFHMSGRLRPGVAAARAEAELAAVARQIEQAAGNPNWDRKGRRIQLLEGGKMVPIRKQDLAVFTSFFLILAGLAILIACANVANMMLARAAERRKEIAVRLSLGASRARLVRQLLTESMLVAAGAGVIGFLMSIWVMNLASQQTLPYPMPVSYMLSVDSRALAFTMALTVFTGMAFGILPAFAATRTDLTPALKEGGAVRLRKYRRLSLRNLLVVQQVAGSLTLLLLTAFLALGLPRTVGTDVGLDPHNLYLISLDPVRDGYSAERTASFFERLLDRVKGLSGVRAASLSETVPVASMNGSPWAVVSEEDTRTSVGSPRYVAGREYFETTGIPIVRGRDFRIEDETAESRAIIVSQELVRQVWKGQDPIGRRLAIEGGRPGGPRGMFPGTFDFRPGILDGGRQLFEVVGVAKDVPQGFALETERPAIYFPLRAADVERPPPGGLTLLVRAAPGVDVIRAVRREISAIDPDVTPFDARSMPEQIEKFMLPLWVAMWTYASIGVFGLVLALVGLAGVTAYSVTQRSREIGIRMALGARSGDVLRLVLAHGAALIAIGATIGLAGAWAGARMLAAVSSTVGKLTGETTSDPVLLVGVPLLLVTLALAACYVPARRSMRIDPAVTLRQE